MSLDLLKVILLTAAVACFLVGVFLSPLRRVDLVSLGLALVALALLVEPLDAL